LFGMSGEGCARCVIGLSPRRMSTFSALVCCLRGVPPRRFVFVEAMSPLAPLISCDSRSSRPPEALVLRYGRIRGRDEGHHPRATDVVYLTTTTLIIRIVCAVGAMLTHLKRVIRGGLRGDGKGLAFGPGASDPEDAARKLLDLWLDRTPFRAARVEARCWASASLSTGALLPARPVISTRASIRPTARTSRTSRPVHAALPDLRTTASAAGYWARGGRPWARALRAQRFAPRDATAYDLVAPRRPRSVRMFISGGPRKGLSGPWRDGILARRMGGRWQRLHTIAEGEATTLWCPPDPTRSTFSRWPAKQLAGGPPSIAGQGALQRLEPAARWPVFAPGLRTASAARLRRYTGRRLTEPGPSVTLSRGPTDCTSTRGFRPARSSTRPDLSPDCPVERGAVHHALRLTGFPALRYRTAKNRRTP